MFSNQNGADSGRVSEKVTRKLLETKDLTVDVLKNYKLTHKLILKRK